MARDGKALRVPFGARGARVSDELARALGFASRWALYHACRQGQFPHLKCGKRVIILQRHLDAFAEADASITRRVRR